MSLYIITRICLLTTLFFLLLFLPSINQTDFVNSTIISKTLFFSYTLLVILSLYTLQIVFSKFKIIEFRVAKIDICISLLFLFIIINRYFIQSNYGFSIRFIELLGMGFLYVILRIQSSKSFIWIFLAIIVSGIVQAVYGNLQLLGYYSSNHSGFKMTGGFFNPGPYAGFLSSVFPIALGMHLFRSNIMKQTLQNHKKNIPLFFESVLKFMFEYLPLLCVISILLVLPASQSRAAWLAILFSSLILLELKYRFLKDKVKHLNKIKMYSLIVFVIILFTSCLFGIYHFKKGSSDGRLFIWKVTTEIIKDNPIFGVGFDRFQAYNMDAQADYFIKNGETSEILLADNTKYAFNELLQYTTENGFIGFFLLLILGYLINTTKNNLLNCFLKVVILSILIFSFFSYSMQILPIKLVLIVSLALLASLNVRTYKIKSLLNINIGVFKISFLTICIIVIINGLLYVNKLYESFRWQLVLNKHLDQENVLKDFEKFYPFLKKDGDFLMNYGATLTLEKKYTQAIAILEQAKQYSNNTSIQTDLGNAYKVSNQYKKAETAYEKAYNMIPSRFYPLYLLAKLYDDSGDIPKAVIMANHILNKKIKIPSTAIKEMQAEMKEIIVKHNKNKLKFD